MSISRSVVVVTGLALWLAVFPACKRSAVEEPNPFGPASFFLTFDVAASPNVLLTSDIPQVAEVRALVKWGGEPSTNQMVVFTILSGPGQFEDYTQRTTAYTNPNGYAIVYYFSPTKNEIGGDQTITIKIQPQTSTPFYSWKTVDIRLLKGI